MVRVTPSRGTNRRAKETWKRLYSRVRKCTVSNGGVKKCVKKVNGRKGIRDPKERKVVNLL